FFQAEDGIRDFHVTGVQTCALPIYSIVALSSGRLPSGIAVIRISGTATRDAVTSICGVLPSPRMAHYGAFRAADGSILDAGLARSEERRVGERRGWRWLTVD